MTVIVSYTRNLGSMIFQNLQTCHQWLQTSFPKIWQWPPLSNNLITWCENNNKRNHAFTLKILFSHYDHSVDVAKLISAHSS